MPRKKYIEPTKVVSIILAGGRGERTWPLVKDRAKPAIPWGGNYRLINIPISNISHSGIRKIYIMIQSQPHSLTQHIDRLRPMVISQFEDEFITLLPPHLGKERFFVADGDSLIHWQSTITNPAHDIAIIVMADQIMKIDFRPIINMFIDDNIDAVMVYSQVKIIAAEKQLGVLNIKDGWVKDMEEKPAKVKWVVSNKTDECRANIAAYAIRRTVLEEMLTMIGNEFDPHVPLSKSGVPWMIHNKKVMGYNLKKNTSTGASGRELGHFEDAGTLDSIFQSQMTLCSTTPPFDVFSKTWPLLTAPPQQGWPPTKTGRAKINGVIQGLGSIIEDDCDITMAVVSAGAIIGHHSTITNSVILDGAKIGSNCHLNNVVIEKDAVVPEGTILSPDHSPMKPIRFSDVYELIKQQQGGEKVDILTDNPVLSDGGILFFPKFFKF